jgi:hypothetical protein
MISREVPGGEHLSMVEHIYTVWHHLVCLQQQMQGSEHRSPQSHWTPLPLLPVEPGDITIKTVWSFQVPILWNGDQSDMQKLEGGGEALG